ncbi:hypothetical protein CHLRE_09g393099v5 [Chlamydomonas reinhardtii]|uniref:Uncharacterized protein n=1 Tax=Chlamydomonas reinhardtii TaxID=3055 RepID=A0A2K3DEC2_CHLRE|nr:uncharacterized protein CHLRE_09g393099v5 [Chlamydomonas reinhardtii]XP_042921202.1 uncharacterized protein CHLRE_09g393099v5 [Chlamydomonas reinhardtii]PNW78879.1 hypothetical protein CHLRE_09g393099v5 [Chlamydomonas reinhardtii]PNW78880.1 hypothetical protein CHLRE_09g393099v5 [Chlamydomonas reinhardtii]
MVLRTSALGQTGPAVCSGASGPPLVRCRAPRTSLRLILRINNMGIRRVCRWGSIQA